MNVYEILEEIDRLASRYKINKPFIVGGAPRDRMMGKRSEQINDIDITTGNADAKNLSAVIARRFPSSKFRQYDDGHTSINISGIKIDFSSNFIIPNIDYVMGKMGIKDIDNMKREIYSRDFTINTLLEDLSLAGIYDLTKTGTDDIKSGIIRCPIDPNITISSDPRRILRAIKYSIKFGFVIDDKLKASMLENRKLIINLPKRFVQDKMNEIIRLDDEKGLQMLIEFKLLSLVPLTKVIYDMLIQKRQLARVL